MERLLRKFHHLVTFGPRVQSVVHQERRHDIGQGRYGGCHLVERGAAEEHAHGLAHQFFLGIGRAELVKLLAPFVNLVAKVNLHGADALAAVAKRACGDIARVLLHVT